MTRHGPLLSAAVVLSLGTSACEPKPPKRPVVCEPTSAAAQSLHSLQCGPTLDFDPINSYQGDISAVHDREDAVVLLNGTCTGTLIAAAAGPVVLTAGHCVGLGDDAVVSFNFEDAPDGPQLITSGTVIEQSDAPDYALLRLDELPAVTPTQLATLTTQPDDPLVIIQHPRGRPKVIAEGAFLDSCNDLIYYLDLDTLVGSSGAGVLDRRGYVIGIHTDGDCDTAGSGTNRGWTATSIVEASPYLQDTDLADR